MTAIFRLLTAALLFISATLSLSADQYFKNPDLKDSLSSWRGDGTRAFLKADGTEGADGDTDATPVIKMTMGGQSHSVYQEIETRDKPITLHVKVEVFASSDFKRSTNPSDYNNSWKAGGTWYWSAIIIPNVDFWIRGGANIWFYKLANLSPGTWTTVEGHFENQDPITERVVDFCIPSGHGAIYLKNPICEP